MSQDKKVSGSDQIWTEIENVYVNLFALPSKKVSEVAKKIDIPSQNLYVKLSYPAALPAMEEALRGKFEFETAEGGYTIIKRIDLEDAKVKEVLAEMKKSHTV